EHPFDDVDVRFWDRSEEFEAWTGRLAATKPDCLIVHQHMPTAARLARRFAPLPVALVRHNFLKPPRHVFSAWRKRHQMRRLSGLAFVSECVREVFEREWPGTGVPLFVTPNGIDPALWQPGDKERVIAFVGRLAPEKGVLEAAEALCKVLPRHPDWRGLFILDAKTAEPRYAGRAMAAIAAAGHQVQLMTNQPHDAVRAAMARSAIVLAPTQNAEPFGRVAIEALSSGAALVASRAGGFVEIAGEAGVLLDTPSAENIAHALERLIAEPARMAALGAAGRERVSRRYDLTSAAAAFDAMVDRLTGGAAPAPS
ncbi:MAG: glycosyltransferase family 4 protein, partial [Pseudomonadota bacterium]